MKCYQCKTQSYGTYHRLLSHLYCDSCIQNVSRYAELYLRYISYTNWQNDHSMAYKQKLKERLRI